MKCEKKWEKVRCQRKSERNVGKSELCEKKLIKLRKSEICKKKCKKCGQKWDIWEKVWELWNNRTIWGKVIYVKILRKGERCEKKGEKCENCEEKWEVWEKVRNVRHSKKCEKK